MRPGMVVKFNNDLFSVFSVAHRTPGNLRGFVQAKMRNLRSGTMMEHRFSSEDKVERAIMDEVEMEYLYDDGSNYYFMNTENYEQTHLSKDLLGDATNYLIPQLKVKVEFYEGKPISVELPATIDMTVVETEPGMKGASVSNVTKPAKMETGLVVQVPPFIKENEEIRVNTAEGTYLERAYLQTGGKLEFPRHGPHPFLPAMTRQWLLANLHNGIDLHIPGHCASVSFESPGQLRNRAGRLS